jgi:hypothetical protein
MEANGIDSIPAGSHVTTILLIIKKGGFSMSTQSDGDLKTIYNDYLNEATRVKKERNRRFSLYRLAMFIGIIMMLASVLGGVPPTTFWWGVIVAGIAFVVALVMANRYAVKEVAKTAQSKPGFTEFNKLFSKPNYWPNELVTGEKYNQFLSLLGRKGSE